MGYLFKQITSTKEVQPSGVVDIAFLGAKVGVISQWTLNRRTDDEGLYDLRATFEFITEALWNDSDYEKRIVLRLSPHKQYRLQQAEGYRTERVGRTLLMEGVTIHAYE